MKLDSIIRAVQSKLPGVTVDGKDGPQTWNAIFKELTGKNWEETPLTKEDGNATVTGSPDLVDRVDDRSEKAIQTLLPKVQPYARALIHGAAEIGIEIKVTSATRTYEEQDDLYAQGRTKPGKIVTNARAGHSNHNFSLAWDVTIFEDGQPVWESPAYKAVGAIGHRLGLTWGGDWKSIQDEPHFELHPEWSKGMSESEILAELRARKENGTPAFA